MKRMFASPKCLVSCVVALGLLSSAISAEPFSGGDIKKGDLEIKITNTGVLETINYKGKKIIANSGICTTGSAKDEWKPWVPQAWGKEMKMESEDTPEALTFTAKGILKSKELEGTSSFNVKTTIDASGKIRLACSVETDTAGLWKRCGSGFRLDTSIIGVPKYSSDGGEQKQVPEVKKSRNLVQGASTIEIEGTDCIIKFTFEGIKAYLFDNRKENSSLLLLEFNNSPAEIVDERGGKKYGSSYTVTIEVKDKPAK
ncbi:MAG TPA: hypothetical protein DCZ94_18830 [Lentisphaeria bacterium]|nr:MAG: hypothetical protein A2X48_22065 [Lentisphaerae bacterium GWF2_49_21]HBC88999.1 hypothetical protein [Lentisphaeria bacterium]